MYKPPGAKVITIASLYDTKILVINKASQFKTFIKENSLSDFDIAEDWKCANGSFSTIFVDENRYYVIVIVNPDDRVLVHESVHATVHILANKGIQLSDSSEEIYAYTTDYIYSELKRICK